MRATSRSVIRTTCLLAAALLTAAGGVAMVRQVVIMDSSDTTISDRGYFTTHSQEVIRLFGPWLRRYWSFRLYVVPEEADRYHVDRGRMTEIYFDGIEAYKEMRGSMANFSAGDRAEGFTYGKRHGEHATVFIPPFPTDDFLGKGGVEPRLDDKHFLRWMIALDYPEGVSFDEGERWFLETHAPELAKTPGMLYFVSYLALDDFRGMKRNTHPRLVEIWFSSYDAWREVFIEAPPELTPPPWSESHRFEEIYDIISGFVGTWPDVDFLHDRLRIP